MNESAFLKALQPYYEAFAERDEAERLRLLLLAMTPTSEIWGPKRVFAGYEQISEKITGFHKNLPGCQLVLNSARIGCAIVGPDGAIRARGEALVELADDGRIQRVIPFWDPLPALPVAWPARLSVPSRSGTIAT